MRERVSISTAPGRCLHSLRSQRRAERHASQCRLTVCLTEGKTQAQKRMHARCKSPLLELNVSRYHWAAVSKTTARLRSAAGRLLHLYAARLCQEGKRKGFASAGTSTFTAVACDDVLVWHRNPNAVVILPLCLCSASCGVWHASCVGTCTLRRQACTKALKKARARTKNSVKSPFAPPLRGLGPRGLARAMSALFDFRSFLTVLLLAICTCTYAKMLSPQARASAPPSHATRLLAD